MKTVLEVEHLVAGHGKKVVVPDLSFSLAEREILLMLGHNGAGKTTILRTIFGLVPMQGGRIRVDGEEISKATPAQNVARGLAVVPQGHGIFPSLTVAENLELGAAARPGPGAAARREVILKLFPILGERLGQRAGTFSGGQQQMLAIGIALMQGPRILMLDEPSIGLAPILVDRVMAAIKVINQSMGIAILMVEQDVKASLPIADRVMVVKTGRKIYDGPVAPLRDQVELMKLF
jgi:branched-chain amino acid transport system ATP-binding protein